MSLQAFNGGSPSYAGEHAGVFINAAFQAAPTLAQGNVKIMPNIKFRSTIQDFSAAGVIDASTCDYDDGFDLNVREVIIEPTELQTTLTLCKETFHDDWQSKYQMISAHDNVPMTFEKYLLGYVGGLIGSEIESGVWRGDASDTGSEFDGFAQRLADATNGTGDQQLPSAQDVDFGDTLAASTTVKGFLGSVVTAIPDRVWSNGPSGLAIYVNSNIYRQYVASLGSSNNGIKDYQTTWWGGNFSGLTYDGIPVIYAPGLDGYTNGASTTVDDVAIATYRDNLIFGTGLMNDMNYADVIDLAKIDGSRNVRVIYRYTAGTQIGNIEDCVFASTTRA